MWKYLKSLFDKTPSDEETREVAKQCLLKYLQNWGQSLEDKSKALNDAVRCAGIEAKFVQSLEEARWEGKKSHTLLAMQFRKDLGAYCVFLI